MSRVNDDSRREGFRRRILRTLSHYGRGHSLFPRTSRSAPRRQSAVHIHQPSGQELAQLQASNQLMHATSMPMPLAIDSAPALAASSQDCPDFTAVANPVEWYPQYTLCLQYFLDHGQHCHLAQALCAYLNIRLPSQRFPQPVFQFDQRPETPSEQASSPSDSVPSSSISLRPYIRRLVVTAEDSPATLQILFGDHWLAGIGPIRQQERLNYLFTAKSSGWAATKAAYDILPDEHVPFLRPLRDPMEEEIRAAEARWSEWLAMEDWMVGPRSPW